MRDTLSTLPDGRALLVAIGDRPNTGKQPLVLYTDGGGHVSCNGPSKCTSKVGNNSCDDKNACTIDFCAADSGCVHIPAHGTTCGVKGVCVKGTCHASS